MSRISRKRSMKPMKVSITIPAYLLETVDGLADEVETFRSEIISMLLEYCFDHEEIIDDLFPKEEEEEAETEEEGEIGES